MKITSTIALVFALSACGLASAQSTGAQDMDMKGMDMKGMEMGAQAAAPKAKTHTATGVVKAVDPSKGTVTLAHGPVKSLKWPAMTMIFAVNDKALFDKLVLDKKVNVAFIKQESDYVVTAVK